MNEPIKADEYLDALNELRVLVLMECWGGDECHAPEEDTRKCPDHHFHQVILTEHQYKKVSNAMMRGKRKDPELREGFEMASLKLGGTFPPEMFEGLATTE